MALDETEGVLPDHEIREAIASGYIKGVDESESVIQPASVDLRLGSIAYRLRSSFLPGPEESIAKRLEHLAMGEIDLSSGAVLEVNRPYLIPLQESLALPSWLAAR